ncbi:disease resistance protein RLM3-like [Ziziphus jujuba]|uniref:ADP-ribosyl cyclase/cyclic ADP-ribose hydrolase n=1 Tax=Ziziphus jujuba TaxID=326968 RepID=A0ABM3IHI5_ZIZJJ|nr:disease resistance protein RLM3-like [Ziziphus jujuba]
MNFSRTVASIDGSRCSIIILSENYASSTWCLDEIVKILECIEAYKQIVLPIFYQVDPSRVRKQIGSTGKAFQRHEKVSSHDLEKMQSWRDALKEVGNLAGWYLHDRNSDHVWLFYLPRDMYLHSYWQSNCTSIEFTLDFNDSAFHVFIDNGFECSVPLVYEQEDLTLHNEDEDLDIPPKLIWVDESEDLNLHNEDGISYPICSQQMKIKIRINLNGHLS